MPNPAGGAPLLGEPLSIEFANTVFAVRGRPVEGLSTPEHLLDWLTTAGFDVDDVTPHDVDQAHALRTAIRTIAEARSRHGDIDAAAVLALNNFAAAPARWRELEVLGELRIVQRSNGRPAEAALGAIADNAIELFASSLGGQVRACPGPNCILFFIGNSRREWCSRGCGNRARAARHYAKIRSLD